MNGTNDSSEAIRNKLKLKELEARNNFVSKYPQAHKYLSDKGLTLEKLRQHSGKLLSAAAISGALLAGPTDIVKLIPASHSVIEKAGEGALMGELKSPEKVLKEVFDDFLPQTPRPLSQNEEKYLSQLIADVTGVKTSANLEGEHLNTSYGYIGAEQHLKRYPGDQLTDHGEGQVLKEGIAPGLGAWGYFASSEEKLTSSLANTEKWYAVVQTLYLPDWNERVRYLREWYKYRKVLIVDVDSGRSVVAAIADSGPAAWTGKHFGGSPEVMDYLGGSRYKKGKVLVFFVDDPENKVPLGPVGYNEIKLVNI